MRIAELIAIAKIRSGKEQQQMATEMGITASRLSAVAKGKLQPSASEVAYLAQQAQTDPLRAIADIESEREPKFAPIWANLLNVSKLYFSTVTLLLKNKGLRPLTPTP